MEWTRDEVELANYNEKAFNAILSAVDMNMFKIITNAVSAREAWEVLQRHCEEDQSFRESRIWMVTTRFGNLRIEDDETISSYFGKIIDIANESQDLGDLISNKRLVSKAFRSLPEKFDVKISFIKKIRDTATLDLTKIMNILASLEMNLDHQKDLYGKKKKSTGQKVVALKVIASSSSSSMQVDEEEDLLQEVEEGASLALVVRKFNSFVRRMNQSICQGYKSPEFMNKKSFEGSSKQRTWKKDVNDKDKYDPKTLETTQCHVCQGFGHYANECANTLRKQGRILVVSLSDVEDDQEVVVEENSEAKNALLAIMKRWSKTDDKEEDEVVTSVNSSSSSDYSQLLCFNTSIANKSEDDEERYFSPSEVVMALKKMFDELHVMYKKQIQVGMLLEKENSGLKSSLARLEVMLTKKDVELEKMKSQLELASETFKKLNTDTSKLDYVLSIGKVDTTGFRFQ